MTIWTNLLISIALFSILCLHVAVKTCLCGHRKKELPCCKDYQCETKCTRVRDCGKHQCKRKVITSTVKPARAVTCIKRSPFSYPVIENFIWIEPLLRGHLSYRVTFSLFQRFDCISLRNVSCQYYITIQNICKEKFEDTKRVIRSWRRTDNAMAESLKIPKG